jgi:hypothetical protein
MIGGLHVSETQIVFTMPDLIALFVTWCDDDSNNAWINDEKELFIWTGN